jgi:hypothetical protein
MNCVVDSRWTCKLTDYGVPTIREMGRIASQQANEDIHYESKEFSSIILLGYHENIFSIFC